MEAELKGSPSYIWRSIWSSRNLVKEGLVWRVGNGRDISIWKEKWLPRPVTYQVQTPPNTLDSNCKVSALINVSTKSWKEDLVKAIFCKEEANLILSIPISKRGASDKRIWAGSTKGTFTVKSAYYMDTCFSKRSRGEPSSGGDCAGMWKDLWKLEVPGKIRMFVWRSLSNVLPTKDMLCRKSIVKNNLCPICIREPETVIHTLWSCPAARDVWGTDRSKLKKWNSSFSDFQQLWKEMSTRLDSEELQMAAVLCHLLWKRRNAFVFKNQFMSPESITTLAQAEVSVLREVNSMVSSRMEGGESAAVVSRQWQFPEWPAVKVNFDAAFDKSLNKGGLGIVVRDCEGKLLACLTTSRNKVFSAAQAEKAALQRALDMCIDMDLTHVVFEGDAKAIIEAVNSRNEDFSWGGQDTDDLQQEMRLHQGWKLSFVHRSANSAAHNAARLAIRESNERVWTESGPLAVMNSVLSDVSIAIAS